MDAVRKDCSRVRNWARLSRARQENSSHLSSQTRSFSLSTLLPCLSSSRLITSFIDFHRLPSASSIRMHPSSTKSDFSFLHSAPNQKSMSSLIAQPNQLFLSRSTCIHIVSHRLQTAARQHAQSGSLLFHENEGLSRSLLSLVGLFISVRRIWIDRICPDLSSCITRMPLLLALSSLCRTCVTENGLIGRFKAQYGYTTNNVEILHARYRLHLPSSPRCATLASGPSGPYLLGPNVEQTVCKSVASDSPGLSPVVTALQPRNISDRVHMARSIPVPWLAHCTPALLLVFRFPRVKTPLVSYRCTLIIGICCFFLQNLKGR